ncbi:hypothetical protein K525DRAFT_271160 [Schizophyllum commune Loenen D]|nr:hypothetical protein K525DRAFT_271160 [Schizophyllum commune Loenen D]
MDAQDKYPCNCEKYCRGGKLLSLRVFNQHRKYRLANRSNVNAAGRLKNTLSTATNFVARPFRRLSKSPDTFSEAASSTASTVNAHNKRPKKRKDAGAMEVDLSTTLTSRSMQCSAGADPAASSGDPTGRRGFAEVVPNEAEVPVELSREDRAASNGVSSHGRSSLQGGGLQSSIQYIDDASITDSGSREDMLRQEMAQATLSNSAIDTSPATASHDSDVQEEPALPVLEDMKETQAFIDLIKSATLDNGGLSADAIRLLREGPPQAVPEVDPDFR